MCSTDKSIIWLRCLVAVMAYLGLLCPFGVEARHMIVADSLSHIPLPNASVYDSNGDFIGMTGQQGALPPISDGSFPLTVSYIGFDNKIVPQANVDTIFLQENLSLLPEVVVEAKRQRALHILAYIREYSSLTTYTDTIFLFREKMVDYMLPADDRTKYRGWSVPRVLTSKSYYRFTNQNGLDSVSDTSQQHFSWSDWLGIHLKVAVPQKLWQQERGSDTILGKYSPTEIWVKNHDAILLNIDVLADKSSRKWVQNLSGFFRKGLDFDKFKIDYRFDHVATDTAYALDLSGYSYSIESNGRGHEMFMFNRVNEPYFVSTQADVYILDKEFISIKEARKWEKRHFDIDETGLYEPMDAPPLSPSVVALIDRVNRIEKDDVRLNVIPDHRLVSKTDNRRNFKIGHRALSVLKMITGITAYKTHKNAQKHWSNFRKKQVKANQARAFPTILSDTIQAEQDASSSSSSTNTQASTN